jgi:hypothetical protein
MLIFLHLVLITHESGSGESKFCAVVIFVHLNTNDVSHYRLKYLWGASPPDCSADSHVTNRNLPKKTMYLHITKFRHDITSLAGSDFMIKVQNIF